MDIKKLRDVAEDLLSKKAPLNSLHQEIADNFYPERADFTVKRSIGTDFASNLMSSYPVQCRRKLGNNFSTMLRPTAKAWFHTRRKYTKTESNENLAFLEWMEETQRRAMYDRLALFTRATKEGDHDFAAFGQTALSVEFQPGTSREPRAHMLYRCWHLRDMAWQENEEGQIGFVVRKWKPTALVLSRTFPGKVDDKVTKMLENDPFGEVECMHIVCDAPMYDKGTTKRRWSIWYDTQNDKIMEEVAINRRHYVLPRWQTVSQSQYSYSPATVCALPDARLLQAMTFTLLEAGEKATSPPLLATKDAIRSDLAVYAGGVTWVDIEYDERLGEALRPLAQDFRGFNYGVQMNQDTRTMLNAAFFLDALTLPQRAPEMTAYEVGQRVQEYIRNALPIFEPMEQDYNGALCDETLEVMLEVNAFGYPGSWPREMRNGSELEFVFESPLHDALEEQKGQKFTQAQALIGQAMALDPSTAFVPKAEVALRDALHGIGVPSAWLNSEAFVKEAKAQKANQDAQQQRLASLEQASKTANNLGTSGLVPTTAPA